MTICAICAEDVVDGARFCPQCGALLGTPSGLEERKLVTAVFADLVGFTSRSEGMDVEDVRGTLVVYFRLLRQELERFGGTVEKFIGDAVVAIFGAPAAHEDDPERAVRAALSIQAVLARAREERPNFDLHVRIGVNTGEALVAIGANPHAGEGLAAGDVVNTAARLQTAAPADGVLVGEMTYRATIHVVDYTGAQAIEVKGKQHPLNVWVAREAASLDADAGRPLAAPLVGRDAQLEALWSTLERVRQERSPRLLTLTGVPGIGKSRLVLELFGRIEDTGADVRCRRGRSLPYGEGVTFWALAEMVKAEAGILHSDSGAAVARKLHQAVVGIVDDSHDAAWIESELRPLVGLERGQDPGADRQAETFAGWRLFLESLARQRPLVLVFEDIHWADQALLEFIEHLADWLAGVPVLVLCTARPELFDQRPGWLEGHANTDAIPLWPLSDGATAELITDLLGQVAAAGRHRADAAPAGRRQPPLRAGVRPDAGRPRPDRPRRRSLGSGGGRRAAAAGDRPEHHRRAPGRADAGGEGDRPGRIGDRQGRLGRRRGARRRAHSVGGRGRAAAAPAQGVPAARAVIVRRRRDAVRLPACPDPRRRLLADRQVGARGQALCGLPTGSSRWPRIAATASSCSPITT